jgi:transposase
MTVSQESRRRFLEAAGMAHARPESVTAALFASREPFFFALDKQQVKYEMLRAHIVDGLGVSAAADAHGYSRAGFYLIHSAFTDRGMASLVDERPGRRGPLKISDDIAEFIDRSDPSLSGAVLAELIADRFGVRLHRRTIERVRPR